MANDAGQPQTVDDRPYRSNRFRVIRRFNRFGWAVDLIEANCGVCKTTQQAEVYPIEPPFMRSDWNTPESQDVRDKWERMARAQYEYWNTFMCAGCTTTKEREEERKRKAAEQTVLDGPAGAPAGAAPAADPAAAVAAAPAADGGGEAGGG